MFKFRQLLWIFLIFSLMYGANNVHGQSRPNLPGKGSQSKNNALLAASEKGDLARVERLLASGAEIGARNSEDQTPLMLASAEGHVNVVTLLINKGAEVNAVANPQKGVHISLKRTALLAAATQGMSEIASLLIQKGADVNARNGRGETALMWLSGNADDSGVIRLLLDKGADANAISDI